MKSMPLKQGLPPKHLLFFQTQSADKYSIPYHNDAVYKAHCVTMAQLEKMAQTLKLMVKQEKAKSSVAKRSPI